MPQTPTALSPSLHLRRRNVHSNLPFNLRKYGEGRTLGRRSSHLLTL